MDQKHYLVIKLGALGDFIQALGPMKSIRNAHRYDKITLLTTAPFESLALESGYFDSVMIDKKPKWFDLSGWYSLAQKFTDAGFDRVYDLQNNDRTSLYFKLFSKKPEWVGVAKGASHRNTSPERIRGSAFKGHVQTLSLAGINGVMIDDLSWMKSQTAHLDIPKPYILVVPGSSPQHPQKRWPSENYIALCHKISAQHITPVLIGTAAEQEILSLIENKVPGVLNLCAKTKIFDLPTLARGALAAIGNDTGPMHLIAPTGCRTLVLFSGKSNPARHAPLGQRVKTLQADDIGDLKVDDVWKDFWTHASSV